MLPGRGAVGSGLTAGAAGVKAGHGEAGAVDGDGASNVGVFKDAAAAQRQHRALADASVPQLDVWRGQRCVCVCVWEIIRNASGMGVKRGTGVRGDLERGGGRGGET